MHAGLRKRATQVARTLFVAIRQRHEAVARWPSQCYPARGKAPSGTTRNLMQTRTPNEANAAAKALASELVRPVAEALAAGLTAHARSLAECLEAPDLADLIEL